MKYKDSSLYLKNIKPMGNYWNLSVLSKMSAVPPY